MDVRRGEHMTDRLTHTRLHGRIQCDARYELIQLGWTQQHWLCKGKQRLAGKYQLRHSGRIEIRARWLASFMVSPFVGVFKRPGMRVVTPGNTSSSGVRSWRRAKIQFPGPKAAPAKAAITLGVV